MMSLGSTLQALTPKDLLRHNDTTKDQSLHILEEFV